MPFVPSWEREGGVKRWMRDASYSTGAARKTPIQPRTTTGPLPALS